MDKRENSITIITCQGKGKRAAKKIIKNEDGSVTKNAGTFTKHYEHEERPVANIYDIAAVVDDIACEPRKAIIREQVKENMGEIVQRKIHEPDAAFDEIARPYVMLDIDELGCPDFYDASNGPESLVKWAISALPEPFQNVTCFYKFSSSQNAPDKTGKVHKDKLSLHLWFWCERPVLGDEWKRYFASTDAPVDLKIFSPVQMHYTANPLFENMSDPLPVRSGIVKGRKDHLLIPVIPEPEKSKSTIRIVEEPTVLQEDRQGAIKLLLPYYKEGSRHSFCGAIAATLYRNGWKAENAAHFVVELAEMGGDVEVASRYNSALDICESVDQGRRAQGIPFLKKYIEIDELDKTFSLLGIGGPDIENLIEGLTNKSDQNDICKVLKPLLNLSRSKQKYYIQEIKNTTGFAIGLLKEMLREEFEKNSGYHAVDWGDSLVESYLNGYRNGQNFFRSSDKRYWKYNGAYWVVANDDLVKQEVQNLARELIAEHELEITLLSLSNGALNLLEGQAYKQGDPFCLKKEDVPSVLNCANGELWFGDDGEAILKPHRADSYLRYYLNVDYDPNAQAPLFEKTVLDIFSKSSDPKDMFRHFMELAGYICQPWRKLAIIVLLYGHGSNGKSSLMSIVGRVLNVDMMSAGRISDIGKDKFQTANLDGKLLLFEDDMKADTRLDDGFLKMISEKKLLTAQQKYKAPYSFFCRAVPVMGSNSFPILNDLSGGMRRRMLAIPFERHFSKEEMDTDLFDRLWDQEAPGILNHFVLGFQRLKKRGQFKEPDDCILTKDKWLSRSNIFPAFIEDRCEVGKHHKQFLKNFYEEYQDYCVNCGIYNVQRQQWIRARLEDLEFEIKSKDGQPMVYGIRAINPEFNKSEINL